MKQIILISEPTEEIKEKIRPYVFPANLEYKIFAYMPADGSNPGNSKYTPIWEAWAKANDAEFIYVDNSCRDTEAKEEIAKLQSANILLITGGNTFTLLKHLRESGLFEAIQDFARSGKGSIVGMSAGAIVLTPSIKTSEYFDENIESITDTTGLNIVKYEVLCHFDPQIHAETLAEATASGRDIRTIANNEFIVVRERDLNIEGQKHVIEKS